MEFISRVFFIFVLLGGTLVFGSSLTKTRFLKMLSNKFESTDTCMTMLQQMLENEKVCKDEKTVHDLSDELTEIKKEIALHGKTIENIVAKLAEKVMNLEENMKKQLDEIKSNNKVQNENLVKDIKSAAEKLEGDSAAIKTDNKHLYEVVTSIDKNQEKILTEMKNVSERTSNTRDTMENYNTELKNQHETLKNAIHNIEEIQSNHLNEIKTVSEETQNIREKVENYNTELKNQHETLKNYIHNIEKKQLNHFTELKTVSEKQTIFHPINGKALLLIETSFIGSSCLNYYNTGFREDGIYQIQIENKTVKVYCDMTTDGGGWTVFQRRKDGTVDFYRNWADYKTGFGNLLGEFWLGNDYLNLLTESDTPIELRIELGDHEGNRGYAKYSQFKIGNESESYKLTITGYSGDIGNASNIEKEMFFSTFDNDNDKYNGNCASSYHGGWWYYRCTGANLNGKYFISPDECKKNRHKCITWRSWKGATNPMTFTEMKFR